MDQPIITSQQLLLAAKTKANMEDALTSLKNIPLHSLSQLSTDDRKKTFWINIYNALTQILLEQKPERYTNRSLFFRSKQIIVAGQNLSLDDIEHGLLRHSKVKWGLGYLDKWFPTRFEIQNRVLKLDYRIHFALNCGAASCPAIAFYDEMKIDSQLELSSRMYLQAESYFLEVKNMVTVPALMQWFPGDFGGRKGIISILKHHEVIPGDSDPSIKYKSYNWTKYTDNYKND